MTTNVLPIVTEAVALAVTEDVYRNPQDHQVPAKLAQMQAENPVVHAQVQAFITAMEAEGHDGWTLACVAVSVYGLLRAQAEVDAMKAMYEHQAAPTQLPWWRGLSRRLRSFGRTDR